MNVARIHRTRYSILLVSGSKPGSVQAQRPNKQSSSAREHRWSLHAGRIGPIVCIPFNPSVSLVPVTANSSRKHRKVRKVVRVTCALRSKGYKVTWSQSRQCQTRKITP